MEKQQIGEETVGEQIQHEHRGVGQHDLLHQIGDPQLGVFIAKTVNGLHERAGLLIFIKLQFPILPSFAEKVYCGIVNNSKDEKHLFFKLELW